MIPSYAKKPLAVLAFFAALWLGVKYLLPVVLPFLLGAGVAVAAEPLVSRAANRLNRPLAAGLGFSGSGQLSAWQGRCWLGKRVVLPGPCQIWRI